MIVADPPRKYRKRGKRWSHVCSPDLSELLAYAKVHGLKRKDRSPFIHYDVTAEELVKLPGITVLPVRQFFAVMRPYRQPREIR